MSDYTIAQSEFDELARRHKVPGAVYAVLRHGDLSQTATGVLNTHTGAPVTVDALFKIGSITKVYTATLVMQLVEEGLLALDQPVAELLPGFRLRDTAFTKAVTVRQLLNHTSGIDGDIYLDTGEGEDALARYTEALGEARHLHEPGSIVSYCNAGYNLAGRIIEVLRGASWEGALAEHLCAPLALSHTVTTADEAILRPVAIGHRIGQDGAAEPVTRWAVPRSSAPSARIASSAEDLLRFAREFLFADGRRTLLSNETVDSMLAPGREFPVPQTGIEAWGIGWFQTRWGSARVLGHDGSSSGQRAFLRVLPEHDAAIVLLTNGGDGHGLARSLFSEFASTLAGDPQSGVPDAALPPRADVSPTLTDSARVDRLKDTVYRSGSEIAQVRNSEEGASLTLTWTGPLP